MAPVRKRDQLVSGVKILLAELQVQKSVKSERTHIMCKMQYLGGGGILRFGPATEKKYTREDVMRIDVI